MQRVGWVLLCSVGPMDIQFLEPSAEAQTSGLSVAEGPQRPCRLATLHLLSQSLLGN